jgi:hypothetical protein
VKYPICMRREYVMSVCCRFRFSYRGRNRELRTILLYVYSNFGSERPIISMLGGSLVLRLRMEETPSRRVGANILKKSRTADKGWSSSWGVGRGLTTHLKF